MSLPCAREGGTVGDGRVGQSLTASAELPLHKGATLSVSKADSSPGVGALVERERAADKPLTLGEVAAEG